MTLSSQQTKVVYEPDGAQTVFPVPFPLFDKGDLECLTVSASGATEVLTSFAVNAALDAVTFAVPPPGDKKLVLRRNTRLAQETDYPVAGRFPAKAVEQNFDRITAMIQELAEFQGRTIAMDPAQSEAMGGEQLVSMMQAAIAAESAARAAALTAVQKALEAAQSALDAAAYYNNLVQDSSAGFFKYLRIEPVSLTFNAALGVEPYAVADSVGDLFPPDAAGLFGLALDGQASLLLAVSESNGGAGYVWRPLKSLPAYNGYLFHVTHPGVDQTGDDFYWLGGAWNMLDANVQLATPARAGIVPAGGEAGQVFGVLPSGGYGFMASGGGAGAVAFGSVSAAGVLVSGKNIQAVSRLAAGSYQITLPGDYSFGSNPPVVVAAPGQASRFAVPGAAAGSSFAVNTYNTGFSAADAAFAFVAYLP